MASYTTFDNNSCINELSQFPPMVEVKRYPKPVFWLSSR